MNLPPPNKDEPIVALDIYIKKLEELNRQLDAIKENLKKKSENTSKTTNM